MEDYADSAQARELDRRFGSDNRQVADPDDQRRRAANVNSLTPEQRRVARQVRVAAALETFDKIVASWATKDHM